MLFLHFRETDPEPNPPYFTSYAIRGTLEYLTGCHKETTKSLITVLSYNKVGLSG